MLQVGCQRDLALEARSADLAGRVGRQDLDDHPAVQGGLDGDEQPAGGAATEFPLDAVRAIERRIEARRKIVHCPLPEGLPRK